MKPTTQRAKRIAIAVLLVVIAALQGDNLIVAIKNAAAAMMDPVIVAPLSE